MKKKAGISMLWLISSNLLLSTGILERNFESHDLSAAKILNCNNSQALKFLNTLGEKLPILTRMFKPKEIFALARFEIWLSFEKRFFSTLFRCI